MKRIMKLLCVLLMLAFLLPVISACKNNNVDEQDPTDTDPASNEVAGIAKKDYNADFTIINPDSGLYSKYYWSEDMSESSNISAANYRRETAIEEHLGIEIYHETFELAEGVLLSKLETAHLGGLDAQQLALTHSFQDLVSLMSSGYLLDLEEVPGISMNEEYWNLSVMESVTYQGHSYLGSSSFILHRPTFILFNKDMAELYDDVGTDKLYQHAREKTWTLDQMYTYVQLVDVSLNDTLTDPMQGTYGFSTLLDWEMCSFVTASGYTHVTVDDDGKYQLKSFNNDIFNIFKKIVTITDSNYFYGYKLNSGKQINMDTGRVFFSTASVETMISQMLDSEVPLGVLPYPTIEEGMTTQNLDWAGYFVIPAVVKDRQMSGEVAELLSYYGETEIKHEFYDVLLGLRASKNPQDTEMLDLVFDNLVGERALTFLNSGSGALSKIFYVVPRMISGNEKAMASWYATNYTAAQNQLDELDQ